MDQQVIRMGRLLDQERNKCTPIGRLADDTILEILRHFQPQYLYNWHQPLARIQKIPPVFSLSVDSCALPT